MSFDTAGPFVGGTEYEFEYYNVYVDHGTNFSIVFFSNVIDTRNTLNELEKVFSLAKTHGHTIKTLSLDMGPSQTSNTFKEWCGKKEIKIEWAEPDGKGHNGKAERLINTLNNAARAHMLKGNVPPKFFFKAITMANGIRIRMIKRVLLLLTREHSGLSLERYLKASSGNWL